MSRFFCDSNGELWYTRADELGLDVIGMPYTIDDEDERDYDLGRNTDFDDFYKRLSNGSIAKTQALNVQNYLDYFEPVLAGGEDIIYIHFSNQMSGTFEQMRKAIEILKEKYPERRIRTADTKLISIGESLLVYEAAKMWKSGASDDDIIEFVEKYKQNYALYFLVDDLGYLRKGGRLKTASFIVGTMLNIKPILKVNEEGQITKADVAKGIKRGLKELVNIVKSTGNDIYKHPLVIAHAAAKNLADELRELFVAEFGDKLEIWEQPIGPTVGAHCGPGSVGIAFHCNKR